MEFDSSNADDADMDACHVENQQKGQYNEVRMSNLESDIREVKEMMKQVLHNQTDLMEMLRHFEAKQVVGNDKVIHPSITQFSHSWATSFEDGL